MRAGPRFSILMPTRNRAGLLRLALQSALELHGDDYEVVVSDNCSSDETADVIKDLADSRVRSVRPSRPLSVAESIEFVFGHARGEHVTLLNDDDALVAGTLDTARAIIDSTQASLVVWPYCHYFYPEWHEARYRNSLIAWSRSGRVEKVQARATLVRLYRHLDGQRLPTFANAVCHRNLIERARRRVPRLFPALACDIFAGALVLAEARTYQFVDKPFTVLGKWPKSLGSSLATGRGDGGEAHLREFPEDGMLQRVPLKSMTPMNLMAEALLQAKAALVAELDDVDLDWVRYFVRCYEDLLYLQTHGADVTEELGRLRAALHEQPDDVRVTVMHALRQIEHSRPAVWRRLRRLVNQIPVLGWLESVVRPEDQPGAGEVLLHGNQAGFANILECARVWGRLLVPGSAEDQRDLASSGEGAPPRYLTQG